MKPIFDISVSFFRHMRWNVVGFESKLGDIITKKTGIVVKMDTLIALHVSKARTTDTQREIFLSKISNFWALADKLDQKFWGIWGTFGRFISTHFGTVSLLSMFSIDFYKKLSLYIQILNIYLSSERKELWI